MGKKSGGGWSRGSEKVHLFGSRVGSHSSSTANTILSFTPELSCSSVQKPMYSVCNPDKRMNDE